MSFVATVAALTFHEAWRRKVVLLALALSGVFLLLYGAGFETIQIHRHAPRFLVDGTNNFLLLAGLYVVHFLTVVLSIVVSMDGIAGDVASHAIQALLTKPMRRWQLLLGKWLGYLAMMAVYVVLLGGGVLGITDALSGYFPPHAWAAVALPMLEAAVLIPLSLLLGVYLPAMSVGVTLFLLYGLAFIGAWVEQVGSFMQSRAAVDVGIVTSLLLPTEVLWRRAAYLLQPATIGIAAFSPFSAYSVPSARMVIYAALYAVAALLLALQAFRRRDL